MRKIYKLTPIILLIITGTCLPSCKKTEYDYQKRPYNDIRQFTIVGSTGDSTKCLISGDSITIYWNPDVTMPAKITPTIVVDGKATLSPASGESVDFSKNTLYKVTAENGDVKTYRLNPVLTVPIPVIASASTPVTWLNQGQLYIYGEYFLANTDPSEIKAYMQRVSDGVEIPLELVSANTTNYTLVANLPPFSADQDTGLHKLYVKAGNRVAQSYGIRFLTPFISNANPVSHLEQEGQALHSGDSITIDYSFSDNYGGKVVSYYQRNIARVLIYTSTTTILTITDIKVTDNTVKLKLPDLSAYVGQTITQYRFIFSTVPPEQATSSLYFLRGFLSQTTPIEAN